MNVNDLIIIVSYCQLQANELDSHKPRIVHVDSSNEIISIKTNEITV